MFSVWSLRGLFESSEASSAGSVSFECPIKGNL